MKRSAFILLLFLGVCCVAGSGWAEERAVLANRIKTAFLFKFTKYVTWMGTAGAKEFTISILGDGSIVRNLKELAKEKRVGDRPIRVLRARTVAEIEPSQILFIASAQKDRLPEVLAKVRGQHTLTVGDTEGFAARGVVINFVVVDETVRFEVNKTAADRSGLVISSEMLKLATKIISEEVSRAGH